MAESKAPPPLDDSSFEIRMLDPASVSSPDSDLLLKIGRLRFEVWKHENSICEEMFPDKIWLDSLDCNNAFHWVAVSNESGEIVAASRLTLHTSLDDDYRDVQLWKRAGKFLPLPTTDLGRLIVHPSFRRRGIAQMMNQVRVEYAKTIGAKSIMVTASKANAKLLHNIGFEYIGQNIEFADRPGTLFVALQLDL